jgi:hypothetical protein
MTINLPFPIAPSAPLVGPSNQTFSAVASDIRLRADLLPSCVAIKFRIVSTVNGQQQISIISDLATTISGETVEGIGYEASLCPVATFLTEPGTYLDSTDQSALLNASLAPAVKSACIDMEGGNQNLCIFNTIPVNTGDPASDLAALAMWQFLCPQLATAASITQVSGSAVTAVDDFGNTLDLTKYAYILLDNAIPGWLQGYNPNPDVGPLVKQATITGQLSYTEVATVTGSGTVNTKVVAHQEFSGHATLIQIPGNITYAESTASEVIPYGLAGYIYNIESIPQYEGSYSIQEQEISDMCPMGSVLNLTGSANAAWSTMNAQVQAIHYDIMAGRTEIRFGPANHLGAKDMVELNRANRGPRPFYLIGSNLANQAGQFSASATNNAQRAPGKGTDQNSQAITHFNLADSQTNSIAYAYGFPGVTVDTRSYGQPNYGNISGVGAPGAPTIHLQAGSGGTLAGCVRLSASDTNGGNVWIHEMPICYDFGDGAGPVSCFALILCSKPYHTSGEPNGG